MIEKTLKLIRESEELGLNSCSSVDECMTDHELLDDIQTFFDAEPNVDIPNKRPEDYFNWMCELEKIFWERNGIYDWKYKKR